MFLSNGYKLSYTLLSHDNNLKGDRQDNLYSEHANNLSLLVNFCGGKQYFDQYEFHSNGKTTFSHVSWTINAFVKISNDLVWKCLLHNVPSNVHKHIKTNERYSATSWPLLRD